MYKVEFSDGSIFEGGQPSHSLWDQIPNKPIKSIEYTLTPFIKYLFVDFEEYNHCVERVRGINKSLEVISKVIIMGRTKNRVYQIMMDSTGGVYQLVVSYGKEYSPTSKIENGKFAGWVNGKPLSGWRQGLPAEAAAEPKLTRIVTKQNNIKD